VKGPWVFPGTLVSSTNKNDHHDITEICLKVALNNINQTYINIFHVIRWVTKIVLKTHFTSNVLCITKSVIKKEKYQVLKFL
jgi:hypothetical protein